MSCFLPLIPNDFYNGLENRFNNETLSIICAIGRLFELKAEQSYTELQNYFQESLYLITTAALFARFCSRPIKQNNSSINGKIINKSLMKQDRLDTMMMILYLLTSRINYEDGIDGFKNIQPLTVDLNYNIILRKLNAYFTFFVHNIIDYYFVNFMDGVKNSSILKHACWHSTRKVYVHLWFYYCPPVPLIKEKH
ncbi:DUF4371 domain-containing protein [Aphis craccivora]|uniref:DUF4371 domain-containing protein n=1 Tax=Aphis craccivora TaxID=307492 RepID=A0A6G0YXU3_APHCR|nr:DUF4371 domain-containing protein [Aphis craccivora]